MIRVAWWTCALLAVAHARVYDGCQLARDLQSLGVHHDHISTWVCIAYHESRFDTAANNPHSGDHGIFQISELYWCGPGKACGVPCHAFRDDDIADDLECALQVHEEHTRLQGDGFLAWVVYPQHCKHNTKKYLAGCDMSIKTPFVPSVSQARSYSAYNNFRTDNAYNNPNIDNLLPPYLAISSIFRSSYGKALDHSKFNGVDWFNYKYDKVDELKLPMFGAKMNVNDYQRNNVVTKVNRVSPDTAPTTTTRTTMTYIPPVMPWRFIETNQFRKKTTTTTEKPTTKLEYYSKLSTEKYTTAINNRTATNTPTIKYNISPEKYNPSTNKLVTEPVITNEIDGKIGVKSVTSSPKNNQTKSAFEQTTNANRLPVTELTSHKSVAVNQAEISPKIKTTTDAYKSPSTKLMNITNTAYKLPAFTTSFRTTSPTYKYTTSSWWQRTNTPKGTTVSPYRTTTTTSKPKTTSASFRSPGYTRTQDTTRYTFKSPDNKTPITTTKYPYRWQTIASTTQRSTSKTQTPRSVERSSRATQSIFDLYLNPTKATYKPFTFTFRDNSKTKLTIFSGGTTTISPQNYSRNRTENPVRNKT